MLSTVTVLNQFGALFALSLEDVTQGVALEEVGGLDPTKAVLVSSSFAKQDGEQYHISRRSARDITLKLGLEPDPHEEVRDVRTRLYRYFMPKSPVQLTFAMDTGDSYVIDGIVESLESALFSRDPVVDISVRCHNPDFRAPTETVVEGITVADSTELAIDYDGTVETGFLFKLSLDRTLNEFTLYNTAGGALYELDFSGALEDEDELRISTVQGDKYVVNRRLSVDSSYLYGINPQSAWVNLYPGVNQFRAYAVGAGIPYEITYTAKYGGL